MNLIIDDTDHPLIIKVASLQSVRMQVYFIENDDYFHNRLMTKDENGVEYSDNDERAIFFNLGVIAYEVKTRQNLIHELVHCDYEELLLVYVSQQGHRQHTFDSTEYQKLLGNENYNLLLT